MILIADKLILCGSCGERIGLENRHGSSERGIVMLKDSFVVADGPISGTRRDGDLIFFCNEKCKDKTRV